VILVDTSVWIDHFKKKNNTLSQWILDGMVCTHPLIIQEICLGDFKQKTMIVDSLKHLILVPMISHQEFILFSSKHNFKKVGVVDVHILASAILSRCSLITSDKALALAAQKINLKLL
jgi:predicted nucleic acid-binding protein